MSSNPVHGSWEPLPEQPPASPPNLNNLDVEFQALDLHPSPLVLPPSLTSPTPSPPSPLLLPPRLPTHALALRAHFPGHRASLPSGPSSADNLVAAEASMFVARQSARARHAATSSLSMSTTASDHDSHSPMTLSFPVPALPPIPEGHFIPEAYAERCTVCSRRRSRQRRGSTDSDMNADDDDGLLCPRTTANGDLESMRAGIAACVALSDKFRQFEAEVFACIRARHRS